MDTEPDKAVRWTFAALAIVASVAGSPFASAETRPRYGRTLEASLLGEPTNFDPHAAISHAEMSFANLVFDIRKTGTAVLEVTRVRFADGTSAEFQNDERARCSRRLERPPAAVRRT